jgi:hypothetical protein
MRPPLAQALCAATLGVVLVMLAACGGTSSEGTHRTPTPQRESDALLRSASNATNATRFSSTFRADITSAGKTTIETGTTLFRAPNTLYMKLAVLGQESDVLSVPPDIYLSLRGEWYSLGDSIINRDAYAAYAKNRGPVDYGGVVGVLKDAKRLPDEAIDETTYEHYSGTLDFKEIAGKVPDDVFKAGVKNLTQQLLQPAKVEVWLDPDSDLPRRMTMDMTMSIAGSDFESKITTDYTSWDQPVDIPPAPTSTKPFSELTGGLTFADLAYVVQFSNAVGQAAKDLQAFDDSRLPDKPAEFSLAQRMEEQRLVDAFDADVNAVGSLDPSARFRLSYGATIDGLHAISRGLTELQRGLDQPGSTDIAKAETTIQQGSDVFAHGLSIFEAELPTKK